MSTVKDLALTSSLLVTNSFTKSSLYGETSDSMGGTETARDDAHRKRVTGGIFMISSTKDMSNICYKSLWRSEVGMAEEKEDLSWWTSPRACTVLDLDISDQPRSSPQFSRDLQIRNVLEVTIMSRFIVIG